MAAPRERTRSEPSLDASAEPRDDRYDLVWFWKQNDSGLYGRRSDLLVEALAASPRVRRIVHFDRAVAPDELLRGVALGRHPLQRHENLVLARALGRLVPWPLGRKVTRHVFVYGEPEGRLARRLIPSKRDYAPFVQRILERSGVGRARTVFWAYPRNLAFPGLVRRLAPPLVVADCIDDQRLWPDATPEAVARTDANYREILAAADLVLANCAAMRDALAGIRDDVAVVEHGVESPRIAPPCPRDLARIPRPILGYAGNLSERVDVGLLRHVAASHPAWSVVLIGSAHAGGAVDALGDLPNVHRLGVRPYPRVRDYVRHFDVALLPHVDTPLTRSMAPLKLGTYCAEGVPVVATRVATLGPLAEAIDVAADADAFVAAIERALAAPPDAERAHRRAEILAANGWERRAEQVLALLDAAWARRRKLSAPA